MKSAPGIVAVESFGIIAYSIPLFLSIYFLIIRYDSMKATRKLFFVLILLFSIVREIHISLSFARAEGAYPFTDRSLLKRNTNLIVWTAVLGVYLLYTSIIVVVYEWASLLTRANLESTKRVKIIAAIIIILFNFQYFVLLTIQANSTYSTEVIAYARMRIRKPAKRKIINNVIIFSVIIVSILTLVPALFYYVKLIQTLKSASTNYSERHQRAIKMLGFIIQPVTLSLLLRSSVALAVAVNGNSSFLNFYVWLILFWMLPELIPVGVLIYFLNPLQNKDQRKSRSSLATVDVRTTSTANLNPTLSTSINNSNSSRISKLESVNV